MHQPPATALPAAAALRALIAEGVRRNPIVAVTDPELLALLEDTAAEGGFEAPGFDSLARTEPCIRLQIEAGIEVIEAALLDHPGVAAHLVSRR